MSILYPDEHKYIECFQYPCNSASTLSQQSTDRHVAQLGNIILLQSQSLYAFTFFCCMLSREAANTHFILFGLTRNGI
jgi:hypothetical protein